MRTTYTSDKVLNLYRATTFTAPANVYAGLLTAVTDEEAGTVTETTYGSYARQAITFGAPATYLGGRRITNSGLISFPAKSDVGSVTVIAVGIYDALTVGNLQDVIMLYDGDPISAVALPADNASGLLSSPAHALVSTSGQNRCRLEAFSGDWALPTGVSENTDYFVSATGLTTDKFAVSATDGGSVIVLSSGGRCLVHRVAPVTVNQNDTPQFAVGKLALHDD